MVRVLVFSAALLLVSPLSRLLFAQDSDEIKNGSDSPSKASVTLQRERFEFEKRKHKGEVALEERRLRVDRESAIWTSIGTMIPLLTALGALGVSLWSQAQQAKVQLKQSEAQFQLKAAELVVGVSDPFLSKSRATVLRRLFPEFLPKGFEDNFGPGDFKKAIFEDWIAVAKLISENPQNRKVIVETWLAIYPDDPIIAAMGQPADTEEKDQPEPKVLSDSPTKGPPNSVAQAGG